MVRARIVSCWVVLSVCLSCVVPTAWVAASGLNLIAYVDGAGDLYVIQPDGKGRRKLASGELLQPVAFSAQFGSGPDFYSWPVWSPDGNLLASFRFFSGEETRTDALYIFDVTTSQVLNAYKEPGLQPIYAYWAPNSQQLAVLLGGPGPVFSLGLWPLSGSQRPKTVAQGKPFYFDWRADAQALVVHTINDAYESEAKDGHLVSLVNLKSGERQIVSNAPAAFGPPSWSRDGKWLAYGDEIKAENKARLMIAPANGGKAKSFGALPPRITLEWSPTQPLLAVGMAASEEDPLLEELRLVDVSSGKTRTLVKDRFGAFFWSPNGERLLYAKQKRADLWTWVVVEVKDGKSQEVVDFLPSRPFVVIFEFFDQYALSHRVWSPDSKHFVFAGSVGPDANPAAAFRSPTVYAVEAVAQATPKPLSDGHVAFWSP